MADLNNTTSQGVTIDKLPRGSTAQRPGSPTTGMIRYNSDFDEIEYYNGSNWINPDTGARSGLGQTSATAAENARQIMWAYPNANDGVYWIDLPTAGPTQIYCLMDRRYDGGGWMMAMKATRGSTFDFPSSYWTSTNTLNATSELDRSDSDAKFHTFNYFQAADILATWPDLGGGRGSIPAADEHCWLENGFYGDNIDLRTFFNTVDRWFIGDARQFEGWAGNGFNFSSQNDVRFYGFNFQSPAGGITRSRWGFGWNENGGGLFPNGNMASDDVCGGIGVQHRTNQFRFSGGDQIGCCQNVTGFNRTARVEIWVR